MQKIRNVIVISDTHCGCKLGLCPPIVELDDNGKYLPSPLQKKVWSYWEHFWDEWVPQVTKGEPYVIVHNGDAIDGNHHESVTQISHNLTIQKRIAEEILSKVLKRPHVEGYYHIRGTEAHVGKSGQNEEELAKSLGAIKDKYGNFARWDLWLRFGSDHGLINFTHHVGTTSSAAYEATAVYKELVEIFNESGRWGDEIPNVVVRSHRHRQFEIRIPTERGYGIVCITPGWQLKTPFVWRGALGRAGSPQIGGYLIREGSEDGVYTRFKVWKIERSATENVGTIAKNH